MIEELLVLHHSHLDVGYTHSQPIVWRLQDEFLSEVVDWLERTAELDERCRQAGWRPEWGDVLRGLDRLQEVAITKESRQMTLRTPATGVIGPLFKAARIALPPNVRDASAA